MCYYNSQILSRADRIRLKQLEKELAEFEVVHAAMQSGFQFGTSAVLKRIPDKEEFEIVNMEWGFIKGNPSKWPFFKTREDVAKIRTGYKDDKGRFIPGLNFLNAVGEELSLANKVYRDAALHRRCLVLSTGF